MPKTAIEGTSIYADLLKTGCGIIFGFLLGLIADPIKTWIKMRLEVREIERLLIEEIDSVAGQAALLWDLYRASSTKVISGPGEFSFRVDRHPYVVEQQRGAFLRLRGYDRIQTFFTRIGPAGVRTLSTQDAGNILFQFAAVHEQITSGELPPSFRTLLKRDKFMAIVRKVRCELQ